MKKFSLSVSRAVPAVLLFMVLLAGSAMGSGFALIEQSASGLGNAFAGGAAIADDPATIYFNPAGMTRLPGWQVVVGGHVVMPSARFHDEGSTHITAPLTPYSLDGGNGKDAGVTGFVPNLYITRKLNDKVALGLGINAPFGLASKYSGDWVGRYHALDSEMLTVNINPSIAYKVNQNLSLGAGLNVQYIKAKLSSAVDFGLLGAAAFGLSPQDHDGTGSMEGDSWGVGYNLGLLYEFNQDTRLGIAYRSRIKQELKGNVDWHVDSHFQAGVDTVVSPYDPRYPLTFLFQNGNIKANVTLPDTLSFSLYHKIDPKWAVMADVTWTNWSLFKELRIDFTNPDPDSVVTTKWKDTYRYSAGVSYMQSDRLTLRTGIAFDQSPVSSEANATPRIPDGDRLWLAAGFGYKLSDGLFLDMSYAHLFVSDPKINKSLLDPENQKRGGLLGRYDCHVNIISAQLKFFF